MAGRPQDASPEAGSAAFYIMLEELMASGRVKRGDRILGLVPESSRMLFAFLHFTVV